MNPYRVLRVRKTASADTITKAYRKLAKSAHPDHQPGNAGAAAEFQAIQDAYELLNDPERRKKYDETGQTEKEKTIPASAEFCQILHPLIVSIMTQVVAERKGAEHVDLVASLRISIDKALEGMTDKIRELTTIKNELVASLQRISTTEENNLFVGLIANQIKMIEADITSITNQKESHIRVKDMLGKYRYRIDTQLSYGVARLPMSATSTAANGWW